MKQIITLATCLIMMASLNAQTTIFVTPDGTGGGTSWTDAGNLENAVKNATSGTEIWVQSGTYYPDSLLNIPDAVKLYGGFAGTETKLSERDFRENPTIIDAQKKFGSVLRLGEYAELNGFTVQNGYAQKNPNRNGGGIMAEINSVIENCIIEKNTAMLNGGGVYAKGEIKIINTTIQNNIAHKNGKNTYGNCITIITNVMPVTIVYTIPQIVIQPAITTQSQAVGSAFPSLSVSAVGGESMAYQWYANTTNSNSGGTLISDAMAADYTPSSENVGTLYYYCTVSNACGTLVSEVSGAHTVTPVCPTMAMQPSTVAQSQTAGTIFSTLSVSANGTAPFTYQWYSNTANNNTSGTAIVNATNGTYIPSSEVSGTLYYYCVVSNACGTTTSNMSGAHTVIAICPEMVVQPSLVPQSRAQGTNFSTLSVFTTGTAPLSYQWYSNTDNNNTSGTQIAYATSASYTPSSATVGKLFYYCKISNSCGTVISNISGACEVLSVEPIFTSGYCSGWSPSASAGSESIGTITWGGSADIEQSARTIIGTVDGNPLTQVWSGPVKATVCSEKMDYDVGDPGRRAIYCADCRANLPGYETAGDLFSFCAVHGYGHLLCPAPWRVPTSADFVSLDKMLGGTGVNDQPSPASFDNYVGTSENQWGSILGGSVLSDEDDASWDNGMYYWTQENIGRGGSYSLFISPASVSPISARASGYGYSLRCVKTGAPIIDVHPSTSAYSQPRGTEFPTLSVSASAGEESISYQWYSNVEKNNTDGTPIPGATSATHTPSSEVEGNLYYYCVVSTAFGTVTSTVSGMYTVTACLIMTENLSTEAQSVGQESTATFATLSVSAVGAEPFAYQWYSNTVNNNTGGTLIPNATSTTYTPPSAVFGTLYYYCKVSNSCENATSNVSGAHTFAEITGCNSDTPGWDSNLGTVSFATPTERTITGTVDGQTITQIWSDAVTATGCQKTTFDGGPSLNSNADCRSNPDHPGDLFSWCAVARYANTLCPAPWRVPTRNDFWNLDKIFGGGETFGLAALVNYVGTGTNQWGGAYGEYCREDGTLMWDTYYSRGHYWSRTEGGGMPGSAVKNPAYNLSLSSYGSSGSWQSHNPKTNGLTLRCVK